MWNAPAVKNTKTSPRKKGLKKDKTDSEDREDAKEKEKGNWNGRTRQSIEKVEG